MDIVVNSSDWNGVELSESRLDVSHDGWFGNLMRDSVDCSDWLDYSSHWSNSPDWSHCTNLSKGMDWSHCTDLSNRAKWTHSSEGSKPCDRRYSCHDWSSFLFRHSSLDNSCCRCSILLHLDNSSL